MELIFFFKISLNFFFFWLLIFLLEMIFLYLLFKNHLANLTKNDHTKSTTKIDFCKIFFNSLSNNVKDYMTLIILFC
ncbi:hypothetical protein AY607_03300 [Acinetobacter sp. SFA]|nr:hypothetical protein AY607_03300 [Acinetobacter sp. SFA]OAL84591.1 hypothetical protein AY605_08000 [Acinetobacter sp. SFD]